MFTISILCHNFQHRLCWMLSSLADQERCPPITVDIAYFEKNGNPTTEAVIDHFEKTLMFNRIYAPITITRRPYSMVKDSHTFNHRGLVRNDQTKDCKTQWMLYSDSDMVYHPRFFKNLSDEITQNHAKAEYMLTSGRMSGNLETFSNLVKRQTYPSIITTPFSQAANLAIKQMSNVGAGFFQLINMEHAPHNGYYVNPKECRDWNMQKKGLNPRSDIQFRKRIGKKFRLPEWFSQNQIHLNHHRDPQFKKHITDQR